MKIVGISILMLLLLMGVFVVFDAFLENTTIKNSWKNILTPFYVRDRAEVIIFYLLILLSVAIPLRFAARKKADKSNKQNQPVKK
jgi:hypothetical protein